VREILVAAADGLHTFDAGGSEAALQFEGRAVTSVMRDGDDRPQLWAIVEASELWHQPDTEWVHVDDVEGLRATCIAFTWTTHVGTSEAHLLRLIDGALERDDAFERAEGRTAWYTPWGGPPDTRSFSEWGDDVYVNVHVGGILRSDDRGATWTPTIDIDADVHQVATAEGLVLAACAGGIAQSTDRGATWTWRTDGLEAPYSRAVVVLGDEILVSASRGPRGGQAAVYRGGLAGGRFERLTSGLPDWFDDNIDTYVLDTPPDGPVAAFGTSDGRLFASDDRGATWGEIASGLPSIRRVLVLP
jgi:hypothetical protein